MTARTVDGGGAVLFDKDGTLVRDVPYNVDPALIELMPGAGHALAALQQAGYRLGVVSNQSGVARGLFDASALDAVAARLRELLDADGVRIDFFAWCPHHPDGSVADLSLNCDCRKPRPGLVLRALSELDAEASRSWLVGDILNDIEAGSRAGCRTVLLDVGSETEWLEGEHRQPDVIAADLPAAAKAILA
jgi:D-glycero-D-manno-heptose 1,7-bisphosphate phosphatase